MIPPFSFIVAYRYSHDRVINLRRVLEWMSGFMGVEIIVVEQDKNTKIDQLTLPGKHIFQKNDGPFIKSLAYNLGFRYSTSNVLVFGDADVIMNPNELISSLNEISKFEVVNPYKSVVDLEEWESGLGLDQIFGINRPGRGETDHQKVPFCGGITIFRRDALEKIAGWPEEYVGWGAEDDAQSIKVQRLLSHTQMQHRAYHLWHHRPQPDMTLYQRNLELLNKFKLIGDGDMINYLQSTRHKIGQLNRFS
jgi:predicted glycosyltransferase involved in capsule biosynthesis